MSDTLTPYDNGGRQQGVERLSGDGEPWAGITSAAQTTLAVKWTDWMMDNIHRGPNSGLRHP
jgi:hypothetical protein